MAKQIINTGLTANDRTGDSLKLAFTKINTNFSELYDRAAAETGDFTFTGTEIASTGDFTLVPDPAHPLNALKVRQTTVQGNKTIVETIDNTQSSLFLGGVEGFLFVDRFGAVGMQARTDSNMPVILQGASSTLVNNEKPITDVLLAQAVVITVVGHGLNNNDKVYIDGFTSCVELNATSYYVYVLDADSFELYSDRDLQIPVDGAGFTAFVGPDTGTISSAPEGGDIFINAGGNSRSVQVGDSGVVNVYGQNVLTTADRTANLAASLYAQLQWTPDLETYDPISSAGQITNWIYADETGVHIENHDNVNSPGYNFEWTFGIDGKLHLPEGGDIVDSNGTSVLGGGGGGTIWTNDANGCLRAELSATGFEAFTDQSHVDLKDSGIWSIGSYGNSTFIGNNEFANLNDLSLRSGDSTFITTNLRENGNYQWKFGTDGKITFPGADGFQATFGSVEPIGDVLHSINDLVLKSDHGVTIVSGEGIDALETSYNDQLTDLTSLLSAELYGTSFLPASHDSIIALAAAKAVNPLISDQIITVAQAVSDAWDAWQAALNLSAVTIGVGNLGWYFNSDGNLTFPNGDLTIGHDPYGDPAIIGAPGKNIGLVSSGVGDGYDIGSSLIWVDSITEPTKIAGVTANNPLFAGAGDVGIVTGDYFYTGTTNVWNFGADGTTTVPGKIWAKASDNGSISFSDNGVDEHGYIKVDAGLNMVINSESTFYIKQAGSDRVSIDANYTTLMAGLNAVIQTNKQGTTQTFTFGADGTTTFPNSSTFNGVDFVAKENDELNLTILDSSAYIGVKQSNNLTEPAAYMDVYFGKKSRIRTTSLDNQTEYDWYFNPDGSLTLPTGGEIKTEAGTGDVVIEANDGTARTWTFGGDGILSLPDFGATPGSGDGAVGDICRNGDTLYFKTGAGWAAIGMTLL